MSAPDSTGSQPAVSDRAVSDDGDEFAVNSSSAAEPQAAATVADSLDFLAGDVVKGAATMIPIPKLLFRGGVRCILGQAIHDFLFKFVSYSCMADMFAFFFPS